METRTCRTSIQEKSVNEFQIISSNCSPTTRSYNKLNCKICRIPMNKEKKRDKNKDERNARNRKQITCSRGCVLTKIH